jgi:hypothetical protein
MGITVDEGIVTINNARPDGRRKYQEAAPGEKSGEPRNPSGPGNRREIQAGTGESRPAILGL